MKHGQQAQQQGSGGMIGEMMLAKTVLEEKNELLDHKDQIIRELLVAKKQLHHELEGRTRELERCRSELAIQREAGSREGSRKVVEEIVRIAAEFDGCPDPVAAGFAKRIISLFQRDYGLEVIAEVPKTIDPEIHQVVEARQRKAGEPSIQVLAKGYRVAERLIKPMLVRVAETAEGRCTDQDGHRLEHLVAGSAQITEKEPWRS